MKAFFTVLGVILLIATIAIGVLFFRGVTIDDNVVFRPVQRPDRVALNIRTEDMLNRVTHERVPLGGETIAVTMVGDAVGPLVVSCFGNASDRIEQGASYASKTQPHGQVFLWDYPGYGDSSGKASADAVEQVAQDLVPLIEARAEGRPIIYWHREPGRLRRSFWKRLRQAFGLSQKRGRPPACRCG